MPAMKPKMREDLAVVELDGEAVIYDDRNGELHHLNPTATIVFSICDGSATVKELSAEISREFGVSEDEVERQIRALLREFRKAELLDGAPKPAPEPEGRIGKQTSKQTGKRQGEARTGAKKKPKKDRTRGSRRKAGHG